MSDKPKLPPRLYYTLAQAANELGCEKDYLIHQGGLGNIELMQYVTGDIEARPSVYLERMVNSQTEESNQTIAAIKQLTRYLGDGAFIVFPQWFLREMETDESKHFGFCSDCIFFHPFDSELRRASEEIKPTINKYNAIHDVKLCFGGYQFFETFSDETTNLNGERFFYEVNLEKTFVLHSELERLLRGDVKKADVAPPPDMQKSVTRGQSAKGRNSQLRTIAALSQALIRKDLTQPHKDADTILAAIAAAGIAPPIKADALAKYLKDASEAE